ncbi:late embryogenesis abundant protein 47-like [Argentina anserina]|uniref:late embryogenesis abundant protein 47-like n=1 Tax=Argentina anserina TaxID=57926 RepID=UPI0021764E93|nr:late embryogenesis abundant protein 47-like [Potentilla anserina]
MSQEQSKRGHDQKQEAVKYADVFPAVQGGLADKAVTPKDAAIMQTAESDAVGQNLKRGAAATLQSAAAQNQRAGFVGPNCMNIEKDDVTVTETDLPGRRIFTESVGGQVVGEYIQRAPLAAPLTVQDSGSQITIGEALEATVMTAGKKPVEWSDTAAIQAAEIRATGRPGIVPGGLAAEAQSAATLNARAMCNDDKTTLGDILAGATSKLPDDKAATFTDAKGVTDAEMRNDRYMTTHPMGVAASVATAARLNQDNSNIPK